MLWSCGEDSDAPVITDSVGDSAIVVRGDTTSKLIHSHISKDSFLINDFIARVDSFFTAFAGGELTVAYSEKSILTRDTFTNVCYILMPVNGSTVVEYNVESGAGNPTLTFKVYEACYENETDSKVAWKEFKRLSHFPNDSVPDDRYPCVSYCNDYAFRTGSKIFWLNTDCGYGSDTFGTLRKLLVRSVNECKIEDYMICNRGDGLPVNH